MTDKELMAKMAEALRDIIRRFERCAAHDGNDPEYIEIATARHRAVLSLYDSRISSSPRETQE